MSWVYDSMWERFAKKTWWRMRVYDNVAAISLTPQNSYYSKLFDIFFCIFFFFLKYLCRKNRFQFKFWCINYSRFWQSNDLRSNQVHHAFYTYDNINTSKEMLSQSFNCLNLSGGKKNWRNANSNKYCNHNNSMKMNLR